MREDGRRHNFIDELFEELSKRVSASLARPVAEVAFRDREGLGIGDRWAGELAKQLKHSHVLVAIVTPNFLRDVNDSCGKELNVFLERHRSLQTAKADPGPHRIVPIFWENIDDCWIRATPSARQILKGMQYSQADLPDAYPNLGLHQLRRTRSARDYDAFVFAVGRRIVELANMEPLPPLHDSVDFVGLPSAFRVHPEDYENQPDIAPVVQVRNLHPQIHAAPASLPSLTRPLEAAR